MGSPPREPPGAGAGAAQPGAAQPAAAQPAVEVEVDDGHSVANDSSLGSDDQASDSTSLRSSILKYEWKHGRRYHSYHSGAYNFPNDDEEQDRLDMIHHVFYRLMSDKLFLAPIDLAGKKVLDIGTGTGIWPIQLGDEHPECGEVVGNDLSAIQPDWVPPNVKFVVDDVEQDWVREDAPFDYVHCRYMAGSIKDWPRLVKQIFQNLRPGGHVELQESANTLYSEDGSLKPDDYQVKMMDGLMEACDKIGRTMDPAPHFERWLKEAGFEGVEVSRFKLPIGPWPKDKRLKEVGSLMQVNFIEGVAGFTAALFTDVLGWEAREVHVLNSGVRNAARNRNVHPMFDFLVVVGRKPLGAE
ncbi:uncharacterized protein MKZ38_008111 [Zalerion maritima]|uniref:Methyltransferase n=1 Tax=Zalerion maritima TaxID=339359 RepID=A0AAD5WVQ7_9PEZI|nr:uncharacterized protein MKZ38_008111 [Zalerion maritima]